MTDKGREREGNEDAVYPHSGADTFPFSPGPERLTQRGQLLIVADGVGGAMAGREASHWAIRVAVERYYDMTGPDLGADLKAAIEIANASLHQYLQSVGTREAGCTMVAAVVHGDALYVANVGDSRAYLLRKGEATRLTLDHTLAQARVDQGLIRPEQVETDPGRSVLTRSLGAGPEVQVDLFPPWRLLAGDVVLLCSDGLVDMVDEKEIAGLIGRDAPGRVAQRLINAANRRGGFDNISVVVARVGREQAFPIGRPPDGARVARRRRTIMWLAGIALLAVVLGAVLALGAWVDERVRETPAPSLTPTLGIASPTPMASLTLEPTGTEPSGAPTSTLAPSLTPTNTPRPTSTPTPTATPTPEPPPPPSEPADGDGDGMQPPEPSPTKPPPPPP